MQDDEFEWLDAKAAINPRNHDGVTFGQARAVWLDVYAMEYPDVEETEDRWNIVGFTAGNLLHVTYTMRGPRKRIISARKATSRETDAYYTRNET